MESQKTTSFQNRVDTFRVSDTKEVRKIKIIEFFITTFIEILNQFVDTDSLDPTDLIITTGQISEEQKERAVKVFNNNVGQATNIQNISRFKDKFMQNLQSLILIFIKDTSKRIREERISLGQIQRIRIQLFRQNFEKILQALSQQQMGNILTVDEVITQNSLAQNIAIINNYITGNEFNTIGRLNYELRVIEAVDRDIDLEKLIDKPKIIARSLEQINLQDIQKIEELQHQIGIIQNKFNFESRDPQTIQILNESITNVQNELVKVRKRKLKQGSTFQDLSISSSQLVKDFKDAQDIFQLQIEAQKKQVFNWLQETIQTRDKKQLLVSAKRQVLELQSDFQENINTKIQQFTNTNTMDLGVSKQLFNQIQRANNKHTDDIIRQIDQNINEYDIQIKILAEEQAGEQAEQGKQTVQFMQQKLKQRGIQVTGQIRDANIKQKRKLMTDRIEQNQNQLQQTQVDIVTDWQQSQNSGIQTQIYDQISGFIQSFQNSDQSIENRKQQIIDLQNLQQKQQRQGVVGSDILSQVIDDLQQQLLVFTVAHNQRLQRLQQLQPDYQQKNNIIQEQLDTLNEEQIAAVNITNNIERQRQMERINQQTTELNNQAAVLANDFRTQVYDKDRDQYYDKYEQSSQNYLITVQNKELKRLNDLQASLRDTNVKIVEHIQFGETKLEQLENQKKRLNNEIQQTKEFQDYASVENQQHQQNQINILNQEINDLELQKQNSINNLNQEVATLKQQQDTLKKQTQEQQVKKTEKRDKLTIDIQKLQNTIISKQEDIDNLNANTQLAQIQLQEGQQKIQTLRDNLVVIQANIDVSNQQREQQQFTLMQIKDNMQKSEKTLQLLQFQVKNLSNDSQIITVVNQDLNAESQNIRDRINQMNIIEQQKKQTLLDMAKQMKEQLLLINQNNQTRLNFEDLLQNLSQNDQQVLDTFPSISNKFKILTDQIQAQQQKDVYHQLLNQNIQSKLDQAQSQIDRQMIIEQQISQNETNQQQTIIQQQQQNNQLQIQNKQQQDDLQQAQIDRNQLLKEQQVEKQKLEQLRQSKDTIQTTIEQKIAKIQFTLGTEIQKNKAIETEIQNSQKAQQKLVDNIVRKTNEIQIYQKQINQLNDFTEQIQQQQADDLQKFKEQKQQNDLTQQQLTDQIEWLNNQQQQTLSKNQQIQKQQQDQFNTDKINLKKDQQDQLVKLQNTLNIANNQIDVLEKEKDVNVINTRLELLQKQKVLDSLQEVGLNINTNDSPELTKQKIADYLLFEKNAIVLRTEQEFEQWEDLNYKIDTTALAIIRKKEKRQKLNDKQQKYKQELQIRENQRKINFFKRAYKQTYKRFLFDRQFIDKQIQVTTNDDNDNFQIPNSSLQNDLQNIFSGRSEPIINLSLNFIDIATIRLTQQQLQNIHNFQDFNNLILDILSNQQEQILYDEQFLQEQYGISYDFKSNLLFTPFQQNSLLINDLIIKLKENFVQQQIKLSQQQNMINRKYIDDKFVEQIIVAQEIQPIILQPGDSLHSELIQKALTRTFIQIYENKKAITLSNITPEARNKRFLIMQHTRLADRLSKSFDFTLQNINFVKHMNDLLRLANIDQASTDYEKQRNILTSAIAQITVQANLIIKNLLNQDNNPDDFKPDITYQRGGFFYKFDIQVQKIIVLLRQIFSPMIQKYFYQNNVFQSSYIETNPLIIQLIQSSFLSNQWNSYTTDIEKFYAFRMRDEVINSIKNDSLNRIIVDNYGEVVRNINDYLSQLETMDKKMVKHNSKGFYNQLLFDLKNEIRQIRNEKAMIADYDFNVQDETFANELEERFNLFFPNYTSDIYDANKPNIQVTGMNETNRYFRLHVDVPSMYRAISPASKNMVSIFITIFKTILDLDLFQKDTKLILKFIFFPTIKNNYFYEYFSLTGVQQKYVLQSDTQLIFAIQPLIYVLQILNAVLEENGMKQQLTDYTTSKFSLYQGSKQYLDLQVPLNPKADQIQEYFIHQKFNYFNLIEQNFEKRTQMQLGVNDINSLNIQMLKQIVDQNKTDKIFNSKFIDIHSFDLTQIFYNHLLYRMKAVRQVVTANEFRDLFSNMNQDTYNKFIHNYMQIFKRKGIEVNTSIFLTYEILQNIFQSKFKNAIYDADHPIQNYQVLATLSIGTIMQQEWRQFDQNGNTVDNIFSNNFMLNHKQNKTVNHNSNRIDSIQNTNACYILFNLNDQFEESMLVKFDTLQFTEIENSLLRIFQLCYYQILQQILMNGTSQDKLNIDLPNIFNSELPDSIKLFNSITVYFNPITLYTDLNASLNSFLLSVHHQQNRIDLGEQFHHAVVTEDINNQAQKLLAPPTEKEEDLFLPRSILRNSEGLKFSGEFSNNAFGTDVRDRNIREKQLADSGVRRLQIQGVQVNRILITSVPLDFQIRQLILANRIALKFKHFQFSSKIATSGNQIIQTNLQPIMDALDIEIIPEVPRQMQMLKSHNTVFAGIRFFLVQRWSQYLPQQIFNLSDEFNRNYQRDNPNLNCAQIQIFTIISLLFSNPQLSYQDRLTQTTEGLQTQPKLQKMLRLIFEQLASFTDKFFICLKDLNQFLGNYINENIFKLQIVSVFLIDENQIQKNNVHQFYSKIQFDSDTDFMVTIVIYRQHMELFTSRIKLEQFMEYIRILEKKQDTYQKCGEDDQFILNHPPANTEDRIKVWNGKMRSKARIIISYDMETNIVGSMKPYLIVFSLKLYNCFNEDQKEREFVQNIYLKIQQFLESSQQSVFYIDNNFYILQINEFVSSDQIQLKFLTILEMMSDIILEFHNQVVIQKKDKSIKKGKKKLIKVQFRNEQIKYIVDIIVIAHNGAKFDNFILLRKILEKWKERVQLFGSVTNVKLITIKNVCISFMDSLSMTQLGSLNQACGPTGLDLQIQKLDLGSAQHLQYCTDYYDCDYKQLLIDYCIHDVYMLENLLYHFNLQIQDTQKILYKASFNEELFDISNPNNFILNQSLSSTSYKLFTNFLIPQNHQDILLPITNFIKFQIVKQSQRGGRTSVFNYSHFNSPDSIHDIDIVSSYPNQMVKHQFTTSFQKRIKTLPPLYFEQVKQNTEFINPQSLYGLTYFNLSAKATMGYFPIKCTKTGVLFYPQEFGSKQYFTREHEKGDYFYDQKKDILYILILQDKMQENLQWIWGFQLINVIHLWGNEQEFNLGFNFELIADLVGKPFINVQHMFDQRLIAKSEGKSARQACIKLQMNGFYGYMGMQEFPDQLFMDSTQIIGNEDEEPQVMALKDRIFKSYIQQNKSQNIIDLSCVDIDFIHETNLVHFKFSKFGSLPSNQKCLYAHYVSQITARARDQLNMGLYQMEKYIPDFKPVYCDTDSIYAYSKILSPNLIVSLPAIIINSQQNNIFQYVQEYKIQIGKQLGQWTIYDNINKKPYDEFIVFGKKFYWGRFDNDEDQNSLIKIKGSNRNDVLKNIQVLKDMMNKKTKVQKTQTQWKRFKFCIQQVEITKIFKINESEIVLPDGSTRPFMNQLQKNLQI